MIHLTAIGRFIAMIREWLTRPQSCSGDNHNRLKKIRKFLTASLKIITSDSSMILFRRPLSVTYHFVYVLNYKKTRNYTASSIILLLRGRGSRRKFRFHSRFCTRSVIFSPCGMDFVSVVTLYGRTLINHWTWRVREIYYVLNNNTYTNLTKSAALKCI